MADWIYPKKPTTAYEFNLDGKLKVGMLIEVEEKTGKGGKKMKLLVGHVNDLLGVCDDCHVGKDAVLIRYKTVWTP